MATDNPFTSLAADSAQAGILNIKSELCALIVQEIALRKWTQVQAAEYLKIAQPRISEIKQAKIEKFTADSLLMLLFKLGYQGQSTFSPHHKKTPYKLVLTRAD